MLHKNSSYFLLYNFFYSRLCKGDTIYIPYRLLPFSFLLLKIPYSAKSPERNGNSHPAHWQPYNDLKHKNHMDKYHHLLLQYFAWNTFRSENRLPEAILLVWKANYQIHEQTQYFLFEYPQTINQKALSTLPHILLESKTKGVAPLPLLSLIHI